MHVHNYPQNAGFRRSSVELRDARLRGVDPTIDPYTRGARLRVWLVSLIESATFMSVAHQLEKPPSFSQDLTAAAVAWGFIVARALIAPICAMYLATLGKRAMVRREMYGNLLLTIGGTIQQILENLQFAADERLIEPLWRMQVLVDRASRATTDAEMDAFDDDLLKALGELRHLRDQLHVGLTEHLSAPVSATVIGQHADIPRTEGEEIADEAVPLPLARRRVAFGSAPVPPAHLIVALAESHPPLRGRTWTDVDYALRDTRLALLGVRPFGRHTPRQQR